VLPGELLELRQELGRAGLLVGVGAWVRVHEIEVQPTLEERAGEAAFSGMTPLTR
jgi:hypothetical protein